MSSDRERERFIAAFLAVEAPSDAHVERQWSRFRQRERRRWRQRSGAVLGVAVAAAMALAWVAWPTPVPSPSPVVVSVAEERVAEEDVVQAPIPEKTPPVSSVVTRERGHAFVADEEASASATSAEAENPTSRRPRRTARQGVKVASSAEREAIHAERERHTAKTLADENDLYRRVRRALAQGNPKRALALIEEHAATFPAGVFAREREVARVQALCALGRVMQARRAVAEAGEGTPTLDAAWRRACKSESSGL